MVGIVTLARALRTFASELGAESDARESLTDSIVEAIEFLMLNGGGEILREWVVPVQYGNFALPRDLRTPIKYKFGQTANLGFGGFYSPYFNYSSHGVLDYTGFYDWNPKFSISPNPTSVQFQPPPQGVRIVATTRNDRDIGKKIMVGGMQGDKEIEGLHNGFKTAGELLTIYKEDDPNKKYSSYLFNKVGQVVKDLTCDYVMLSGIDFRAEPYHLAFYHPDETVPVYTQGSLAASGISYRNFCFIHILGRVNPSTRYVRDEDVLPIDSTEMLRLLAKRARYEASADLDLVTAYEARIKALIKKTVAYQQAPNRQVSVNLRGSGYTLGNI